MIQPSESSKKAVRAVFIVAPKGIIGTVLYYSLSTGWNLDEMLRVLIALQTVDAFALATPADRTPDDDVIVSPAGDCGVTKKH